MMLSLKYRPITFIFTLLLLAFSGCTVNNALVQEPAMSYLVYASDREGQQHYYQYSEDQLTPLNIILPTNVNSSRPVWLSDKAKWLVVAETASGSDIYLVDETGQNAINLTNSPERYNGDPEISPDGKTMTFVGVGRDLDIFVMDLTSNQVNNLTDYPSRDKDPVWIDDQWILFSSNQKGTPNIFKMRKDGSDITDLTNTNGVDGAFDLAPSKEYFVFESDRNGNTDLFLYNLSNNDIASITNNPGKDTSPIWSPNEEMIAFLSDQDGGVDIYTYEITTGRNNRITNSPDETKIGIAWSPNNDAISYVTDVSGNLEVMIVFLTGEVQNISNNPANDYSAGWIVK